MANYVSKHTGAQIDSAVDKVPVIEGQVATLTEEIAGKHYSLSASQIEKCKEYASRINEATGKTESFLFFTDPHYGGTTAPRSDTLSGLRQIAEVYNNTPTSMCVCGGDWLNNGNTKENACWQLGVYDGMMKSLFDRYVMLIGNHDTNYQGKEYMASGADGTYDREEHEKCILPTNVLRNLWHRRQGNSYFVVDGDCTKFYAFDTGLDWSPEMDEYKWEQIDWFASDLLSAKPERCAALMHIAKEFAGGATPFVTNITQVAKAYNTRSSVTLNGKTYNYSSVTGKFKFIISGHGHADSSYVLNDIVIVMTTNLLAVSSVLTFDLVLVDYAAEKIHMVRVGSGNSRTISLTDGSVTEGEGNGESGGEEEPDDGGGFDGVNLFTYGVRTDYFYCDGTAVTDSTSPHFSANASDGYIRNIDAGGNSAVFFKNDKYTNDGSTFKLSANFVNETAGHTATPKFFCKMLNSAGEVYQGAVTGWTYNAFYKGHYSDEVDSITFTLPEAVREFQIGFLFNSVENNTDYIRVCNISLQKK